MPTNLKDILEECYPNSLIIEYHRVFGNDNTKKLIEIFGGTSFHIPTMDQLNRLYRRKERESEKALREAEEKSRKEKETDETGRPQEQEELPDSGS